LDADLKLASDGRLKVIVSPVFEPLCEPSRYKAAHGGRGSGKSQFFADWMIIQAARRPGFRALCCREIQKSLKESAKRLLEYKIQARGLGHLFDVQEAQIKTPGDGLIAFAGLQDHTAESIKSYEGFDVAWVEEAQTVSPRSLQLLRPTIRAPGSELWFSWNPRHRTDPVDMMFRGDEVPTDSRIVRANWDDNEWFPAELEQERLDCLRMQPDQYEHIWEGGYITVAEGAYYAKQLADAKAGGRIDDINPDPLLTIRLFVDIGGTGARADAFVIWVAQFAGSKIKVLDHYETVGQELGDHLAWLRSRGYTSDRAQFYLPHDGRQNDKLVRSSYETALRDAGYKVTIVGDTTKGAKTFRIEATRRCFPNIWFDDKKTEAGRLALGWYHEKRDEERNVGLGPEHDWSSHSADAFGLMCVAHEEPKPTQQIKYSNKGIV
jgi:phage terminase large subunit